MPIEPRAAMPPDGELGAGSDFQVWEGVYESFAAAPAIGPGFDGPIWRDRSLHAARQALSLVSVCEPLDYSLRQRNALLPTLTAAILAEQARVSILDFGGGLATGFAVLAKTMPGAADRLDYSVVEVDSICRAGRELFAGRKGPTFHSELPAAARFDVVHSASVMQYVEDWQGVIAQLAGYGAPYMSFSDVFIGPFATYVTLQNYYGSRIRHWFFNADEFLGEVQRNGYQLIVRTECDAKILGKYGPLPMENFLPALRIPHSSHLLFSRRSARA
jgi:putative methyltransferase (TIGR04325 family)